VDWTLVAANFPLLLRGTLTTIELALVSFIAGSVLGFAITIARTLGGRDVHILLGFAVDVVRGSPLLVQLLVIYLGASALGMSLGPFAAALLGLSVNAAAYLSEIFRGGIGSIARGQTEAGLAVGLTPVRVLWEVVLPQSLPVIVPAMMGFFIGLLKDTSLAYVLGLLELTRVGKNVMDRTFQPFEISLVVAAIYFILCYPLAQLVRVVDARMRARGLAQAHV
jgi:polar amino acid transport system permease protein